MRRCRNPTRAQLVAAANAPAQARDGSLQAPSWVSPGRPGGARLGVGVGDRRQRSRCLSRAALAGTREGRG